MELRTLNSSSGLIEFERSTYKQFNNNLIKIAVIKLINQLR